MIIQKVKFRFQTGSIKSNNDNGLFNTSSQFRFQTGSIKRTEWFFEWIDRTCVSIPNWFD